MMYLNFKKIKNDPPDTGFVVQGHILILFIYRPIIYFT